MAGLVYFKVGDNVKMNIVAPLSVTYTGNPTLYTVSITGDLPKGGKYPATEESLWVRQDVFVSDATVLAQYVKVTNRKATLTLGPTPSWPNPPGGGGRIEVKLLSMNGYRSDKVLATTTINLEP